MTEFPWKLTFSIPLTVVMEMLEMCRAVKNQCFVHEQYHKSTGIFNVY